MANFPVPNWSQTQLAAAAGLSMQAPVVVLDNDSTIVFRDLTTRDDFHIRKRDGRVLVDKNERKEKTNGSERKRPAGHNEGFL